LDTIGWAVDVCGGGGDGGVIVIGEGSVAQINRGFLVAPDDQPSNADR